MIVTVIGLGLIGGSAIRDLQNKFFAQHYIGVDNNPEHAKIALEMELVNEILPLEDAVKKADIILISIPVNGIIAILPKVLDLVREDQTVIDMGSIKKGILDSIEGHPNRGNFVAAHPMAGTEFSGPTAAIEGLFQDKKCILCDMDYSFSQSLAVAERLFSTLGMETIFMEAREHDLHAAYVSHISHITSFVLSLTVLEQEKDRQSIFDMAAGGFESTVRLANSSAEMWTPIFEQNAEHLSTVIATCIDKLESFKKHIENKDTNEITSLIKEANKITKVLGEKKPSAGSDDFKSEYLL